MNALGMSASHSNNNAMRNDSMKSPLMASLMLHLFLILLFSGAFFIFSKPVEFPEEPMAVEILPIMEKASSTVEAPVAKKIAEPEEVSEEPPPMPKAQEMKAVPEPAKPKPAPKVEAPKPEKVTPKEKPVEKVAEVAEKKAAPAPAKPEVEKKPEPAKTQEVKEAEPEAEASEFSSVLKNLVGEEAPPMPDSVPRDTPRQAPQLTSPAPLGSQMSMSQMDALRAQLAQCWRVLPGAANAATLVVDIEVVVGPNKIVQDARIVDQLRYGSDSFFRAAADSAMAALRSPTCTPLDLPDDKYDQWKNMTVRFDPKDMF